MKTSWLMAGAACLALAACSKTAANTDTSASAAPDSTAPVSASGATADNTPASGMPGANPAAADTTQGAQLTAQNFVQNAAAGDMFEIASSKVALDRSHNPAIKAFARMMITDHTKTTAGLKDAIAKSGQSLPLPDQLPADKQQMLQDLQTVPAADFDRKFMDDQVAGHQAALDLMSRYATDGTVPALQAAARKTGPLVQMHLDKANAVRKQLS